MMLESFLIEGRQDLDFGHAADLVYGQSITDACMSWETTTTVLTTLADAIAERRSLVNT